MGRMFTSPKQTRPGLPSQRREALWGDVGHPGLRRKAAVEEGTCGRRFDTVSCWFKESSNQRSPRGARKEERNVSLPG